MENRQLLPSQNPETFPILNIGFPFTAEHFLEAVDDAAQRSRRLLVIIVFTSIIILMALINSFLPKYNWYASKSLIYRDIIQYIYFPSNSNLSEIERNSVTLEKYIFLNEKKYLKHFNHSDTTKIKIIGSKYNQFPIKINMPEIAPVYGSSSNKRFSKYRQIGQSIEFAAEHQIVNKEILQNYIDKMDGAEIEHIDLVRVPILGVSFHINYLSFYSGLTLIVLYFLFYFSLKREHINTKIAFRRGWDNIDGIKKYHHYYYYEYVSMLQVLSIPRKLFVPQKPNTLYNIFSNISIFFPLAVYILVVGYDLISFKIGEESNNTMAYVSISFSIIFFIILTFLSVRVSEKWKGMDEMWENQALEFNFECILEKLKIDTIGDENGDFVKYTSCTLEEEDVNLVKYFWYVYLNSFFEKQQKTSASNSLKMFSIFINNLLEKKFKYDYENIDINNKYLTVKENADMYWSELYKWYNGFGRKEISSTFRVEFLNMLYKIKHKV